MKQPLPKKASSFALIFLGSGYETYSTLSSLAHHSQTKHPLTLNADMSHKQIYTIGDSRMCQEWQTPLNVWKDCRF